MKTEWLKAALIRAVKTAAQTAGGILGTAGIGLLEADWTAAASVTAMAFVLSWLNSLAGLPEVDK